MAKNAADVAAGARKNGNHKPNGANERHGSQSAKVAGLRFDRFFTPPGSHAYDLIDWEHRTAGITGEKGQVIFEQKDVEVPKSWSQLAINVVAQKYFRGSQGSPERETSVRQIIDRVVDTLARWGREGGYFATDEDAENWAEELRFLLVTQQASFNSPVWFNIGVPGRAQQGSACFINSVQDSMESILELVKTEGMLFKFGSGTGTNLSVLRSSREQLSGGGTASGPVSFMKGYDSFAGSIKSGGTTRRAAKMVILNADHPDVLDFIRCKAEEEKKAWALIEAGYNVGFNVPGGAYDSIQFQNANNSVRVSDEFMKAVESDKEWETKAVVGGRTVDTFKARTLWREIAEATWICGDPGLQFDTTIQDWNVVPNTGRINATNPCFTGDSLVHTSKGLIAFSELIDRVNQGEMFKVYTHDLTNPDKPVDAIELTSPEAFMVNGYKEVIRLRFSNGMEVRCTPNHRFFTLNRGYVPADQLTSEDRVVTLAQPAPAVDARYEIPVGTDVELYRSKGDHTSLPVELPTRWTAELAHYLGWMVGDGFVSERLEVAGTVYGSAEDQELILPAHQSLVSAMHGGFESRISVQANGVQQLRIGRKAFSRYFSALGLSTGRAAHKVVPWTMFQAPPDIAAAFLRGLFDADGCVRDGGDKGRYVGLGSRSEELLRGVQRLLTTFGIASRVYKQNRAAKSSFSYVRKSGESVTYASQPGLDLRITARSIARFAETIGFSLKSKMSKLESLMEKEQYATDVSARLLDRTSDGVELTYNLTEPRNHSYVVNGLVVANCSEFVFLDDTACNLLSLNLAKFQLDDGTFSSDRFRRAVDITFTAQEIIVSNASYPTPAIAKNSEALRPLGLGYANLGALLMSMGLAYDSDEGRHFAGAITAIMTGEAFAQSARMAQVKGPFSEFPKNREPMLRVMEKHRQAAHQLNTSPELADVVDAARDTWDDAVKLGRLHGYRNAQASVIAPTGTISLMMDCDTTGIEPDLALVKYKKLVGGGLLKIVNNTVPAALRKLGYDEHQVKEIVIFIDENDTIEGAPHLAEDHLKVFDCAFKPINGTRSIAPMGHVRMMAGVQPFISGSMSKTVNLPTDATVEDIEQTYFESWKLGLKCIAIYRDGCKRSQPLSTSLAKEKKADAPVEYRAMRRKLPDERKAVTHKFDIAGHEGYLTVGLFEDGTPGELFVTMAKEGSTISGLMDAFATQTSYALQFGVPVKFMVDKFSHMRFEPSGFTKNKEIPIAKSIVDYIFRWMASHFLGIEEQDEAGVVRREAPTVALAPTPADNARPVPTDLKVIATPGNAGAGIVQKIAFINTDAPACPDCGAITVRSGSCYKCLNCGATTGCS
jgi:ribonucleoside-diphosphate reductase alpha chain